MGLGIDNPRENTAVAMTIAGFTAISWYIAVELFLKLFFTFKRKRGLYFWSCLIAALGVLVQPMANIGTMFEVWTINWLAQTVMFISWAALVGAQSFVLYSRLHLVMNNTRWVLWMVIFVMLVFLLPTFVMGMVMNLITVPEDFNMEPFFAWDKAEMVMFFALETVLSGLYIFHTHKHLRNMDLLQSQPRSNTNTSPSQKSQKIEVFRHLIATNVLIILLDISLLALSFADMFLIQSAYKPCVYGVKLRIEFAILNRLIAVVQRPTAVKVSTTGASGTGASGTDTWKRSRTGNWKDATKLDDDVPLDTYSCRSQTRMVGSESEIYPGENKSTTENPFAPDRILQVTEISVDRPLSKES
ncbi:hypothetical protein BDV95DRAFT_598023 [Massariosphaeria phaeospora]|uniref:DUF7703 domain-containing protein n=1 Tax=Massariosphaeria phaeospora TaxID=100035 RepID=A0A7C8MEA2_9PLEO|nr:hypothetical protein BDV95DRAFT_598023 [Massariosphaeria phaeospora]